VRHAAYIVDAFTSTPFTGNPAAVVVLDREMPASWMQDVAAEFGLSETAFVRSRSDQTTLRWFTPRTEVALCGHATLATAHILWESGRVSPERDIRFETASGALSCTRRQNSIELDFPALPPVVCAPPSGLQAALGTTAIEWVGRSRFDIVVLVDSARTVEHLDPDMGALERIEARGVCVTAPGIHHDFVSRFFAPRVGVPEDPVTGSAHSMLAPFWAKRLERTSLHAVQLSQRRGTLHLEVRNERVGIRGEAVTIFEGTIRG
jgi:PhzF family phenazine biosynthesis protein